MKQVYYETINEELIKKLNYLNKGDYINFFKESDSFLVAIYLTYFSLAEDVMINRNSKNKNISTRFTKNIDDSFINSMFKNDIPINYIQREINGISNEWLLSTMRNAIIHNGPEVDYDNKTITLKNEEFINLLECTIPFKWFERFMRYDISEVIDLNDYTYHIFNSPPINNDIKVIQNDNDIIDYIEKEMNSMVINIKYNENSTSNIKLQRREFITITEELSSKFYNLFYYNDPKDNDFDLLKIKIETELTNEKSTLSKEEYNKLLYFTMFKEYFTNKFKLLYPNYNISIEMFKETNYIDTLFKTPHRKRFFFREKPALKGYRLSHRLQEKYNRDKIENLSKIYSLYDLYTTFSKIVIDEFQTSKFMEIIAKDFQNINHKEIEDEYAKVIKEELEQKNIELTYDNQITDDIIWGMNISFYDDEIYNRCRELTKEYKGDIKSKEYHQYIKENLKKEFSDYYRFESNYLYRVDAYPDQVLEEIHKHDIYAIKKVEHKIQEKIFDITESLLYIIGINLYVMNKEPHFKELDYSFINTLDIKCYSNDLYREHLGKLESERSDLNSSIKNLEKTINGIAKGLLDKPNNQKKLLDKAKKELELKQTKQKLKELEKEISKYEKIVISRIPLEKTENDQTATIIRNCFAHSNRIRIAGFFNGQIQVTLTDYDNEGNLSGVVYTNLSSILEFLKNEVFENKIINDNSPSLKKTKE